MGKFSEIEKMLKELDQRYQSKWEAEKKMESEKEASNNTIPKEENKLQSK